ncbi:TonB-dependent receptor [Catenovulum sediminis]|uniref:TonB-dependent receptor n=1 Tax=Catenovulum sediminis TaxID=1740262 RepID=A0ABV1RN95_9ALTE
MEFNNIINLHKAVIQTTCLGFMLCMPTLSYANDSEQQIELVSKKDTVGTQEVISVQGADRYSDADLAESLSRVPGVSIDESSDSGRQVSMRGLGPRYIKTTINGMESAASGTNSSVVGGSSNTRSLDFGIFASELFTQIEIEKTPSAEIEDGGIGGNVNLQAARPFQYDGSMFSYSFSGRYYEISSKIKPRMSFMASKNWNNKFGILGSIAYSKGLSHFEGASTVRWTVLNPKWDENSTSVHDGGTNRLLAEPITTISESGPYTNEGLDGKWIPRIPRYSIFTREQERFGTTAAIQYFPFDDFSLNIDWLYASIKSVANEYQNSILFRDNKDNPQIYPENVVVDVSNNIVAGAFSNARIRSEVNQGIAQSQFEQATIDVNWKVNDSLKAKILTGYGQSELDVPYQNMFALDAHNSIVAYSWDTSIEPIRLINEQGLDFSRGTMNASIPSFVWLPNHREATDKDYNGDRYTLVNAKQETSNGRNYHLALTRTEAEVGTSENYSIKLDFLYSIDTAFRLKLGSNIRSFKAERHNYRNYYKRLSQDGFGTQGDRAEAWINSYTFSDGDELIYINELGEQIEIPSLNGERFSSNLHASGVDFGNAVSIPVTSSLNENTWLIPDFDKLMQSFGQMDFMQRRERFDQAYVVKEEVIASYVQLDWDSTIFNYGVRGNIGLRHIQNTTTSSVIDSSSYIKDYFKAESYNWSSKVNKDSNLLPSFNLSLDLTDTTLARISVAKAITRPSLDVFTSKVSIGMPSENSDTGEVEGGLIKRGAGPTLKPYESTQMDLALDWYFADGALLAGAFFYKNITSITTEKTTQILSATEMRSLGIDPQKVSDNYEWSIESIANTPPQTMWGVEFVYQQPFTFLPAPFDGLGIKANYTYVDYTRDVQDPMTQQIMTLTEEDSSKNMFHATLYYEGNQWGVRLGYNYRQGFVKQYRNEYKDEGTFVRGYESTNVWKISGHINLMDDTVLSIDINNITNEPKIQWGNLYNRQPVEYLLQGRSLMVGIKSQFN